VANPSDLKKDLRLPIFSDRFDFRDQFCVIDAAHFLDAYEVFASIEKQIASSSVFIINKTDLAPAATIAKIKETVSRFHPAPLFFEATYGNIPLERFFELNAPASPPAADIAPPSILTPEQLDAFIDNLLDSPDLQITPPDTLVSTAYQWLGADIGQVKALAAALPKAVVRAKGFVRDASGMQIFNYVMGTWTIEPSPIPEQRIQHPNIIVLIGPPESMDGIATAARTGQWKAFGVHQPYPGQK
jgi:G3E family GTPase